MIDLRNDSQPLRGGHDGTDTGDKRAHATPPTDAALADQTVSEADWRRLYDLTARVRELEPWAWLEETAMFGIRDPENDDLLFVSIMGNRGEHLAVAVYYGAEGLAGFRKMQEIDHSLYLADVMMTLHHAQAVFGDRGELMTAEREQLKALGLRFRGRQRWPYFRGYRPGWQPWMIDAREARWLMLALEQTLDVAPRLRDRPGILDKEQAKNHWMIRVLADRDGTPVWTDSYSPVRPSPTTLTLQVPGPLMERTARLPGMAAPLEVDVFPSFMSVSDKPGQRPQSPFLAMAVNGSDGMIAGFDFLPIEKTVNDMRSEIPECFLKILVAYGFRPAEVHVPAHNSLHNLLNPVCRELKIRVAIRADLPCLNEARQSMMNHFTMGA